MQIAISIFQVVLALILLDVWLLRSNQRTAYRGGDAHTMKEEFAVYGLPAWAMYVVGVLKVGAAVCLLAGLWFHTLVFFAALVILLLMVGALVMHWKIRDPWKKSYPALLLLAISTFLCVTSYRSGGRTQVETSVMAPSPPSTTFHPDLTFG